MCLLVNFLSTILPCSSIYLKRFWTGPSCFGLVQIILDMFNRFGQVQKWPFLVLIFFYLTHVQNVLNESKMIMIGPKQFGSVQNCFGSIEEQEKVALSPQIYCPL